MRELFSIAADAVEGLWSRAQPHGADLMRTEAR